MKNSLFVFLLALPLLTFAQQLKWFDPVTSSYPVIDGRGWHKDLASPYDRFPAVAEKNLRPVVWNLSRNSAGQYIGFTTNSRTVVVKFAVKGAQAMAHMPSTGVAGVDLYAFDKNGKWKWAKGSWKFGDTITYRFDNMELSKPIETFRLYLPLYTSVQWMQIGVPEGSVFEAEPISNAKPIVAYGTSIMHGACASRPGLAWTNILGRKLNTPLINLGFSGNGQLEPAVIDLINGIDASLYILDCMPNLTLKISFLRKKLRKGLGIQLPHFNPTILA